MLFAVSGSLLLGKSVARHAIHRIDSEDVHGSEAGNSSAQIGFAGGSFAKIPREFWRQFRIGGLAHQLKGLLRALLGNQA